MTTVDFTKVKGAYLIFLDLIKKYRVKELGKLGLTHIPKTEIEAIPDLRLTASIDQLVRDQVLGPFKVGHAEVKYDEKNMDGTNVLIVNCIKTAEDIGRYNNSLIIEAGWLSVIVESKEHYTILTRRDETSRSVRLNEKEGRLVVLLINKENQKKSRKEMVRLGNFRNIDQISGLRYSIRKKLEKIGFSPKETEEMVPSYLRGES